MKTLLFPSLLWAVLCTQVFAQDPAIPSTPNEKSGPLQQAAAEPFYDMLDESLFPPAYPGGEAALLAYLEQNIRYPAQAKAANIQGVVALTFIVEKDGMVNQVAIVKDIGGGCAEEAARVVSVMPNWRPGTVEGKPVRVKFTLPVRFRLEGVEPKETVKKKKWWQREALFGENR